MDETTRRRPRDQGFTLIELLVVVIIIGILAAIAIPVMLRHRERAWDTQLTADLRNAATRMEQWATINNGTYHSDALIGFTPTAGVITVSFVAGDALSYCLTASHTVVPDRVYDKTLGGLQPPGASC